MSGPTVGVLVHDFFVDYLSVQKGLRHSSIQSYRDTLRLFLPFIAKEARRSISRLQLEDLSLDRVLSFLRHMERDRHNSVSTRNQRLAALRTFFEYVGRRSPESLRVCQQVAAIPTKRTPQPDTRFIAREQVNELFDRLPNVGRFALRDCVLLRFLYNTGARVQEVADLRVSQLRLERPPYVRLHGKGDKWRQLPLWDDTAAHLAVLLGRRASDPEAAVFVSACGRPLTRFGIYKRVRCLTEGIETTGCGRDAHRISPHVWRHTAAVHLLESGAELNVIRGWLGHVSPNTTNRYAQITMRMKTEAMTLCAPAGSKHAVAWTDDPSLLDWLSSL